MKKKIGMIAVFVLFMGGISFAQSGKYMMAMGKNLGKFGKAETVEQYVAVANQFETIAKKEKTEWLPWYYNGLVNIIAAFDDSLSKDEKDALLDKAQTALDSLVVLVPQESEVFALEGFMNVGRLVVDPASRGAEYSAKVNASCQKALALSPDNPRAKYLILSNQFGGAQFFGADTSALCEEAREQLANWDNFKPKSRMHPNWGKSELQKIVDSCKD